MHQWLLTALGAREVSLVGLGFGGWIAAEMASLAPTAFHRLVLVGAMGIKPPEGDIADQAIVSYIDYPRAGFHDASVFERVYGGVSTDQLEAWDIAREMCFRTAWKPYMYSPALPHLLGGVQAPALVVWGDDDRIVPRSAADAYVRALPSARLEIVPACGHLWIWKSRTSWPGWSPRSSPRTDRRHTRSREAAMHLMYFTEQPMGAYDAQEGLRYGATALTFSNSQLRSGGGQPAV